MVTESLFMKVSALSAVTVAVQVYWYCSTVLASAPVIVTDCVFVVTLLDDDVSILDTESLALLSVYASSTLMLIASMG